jgi:hypothetical protein
VRIQFIAARWALKISTYSIVPSGHSASTDQYSASPSTTQKIGFGAMMDMPAFILAFFDLRKADRLPQLTADLY